MVLKKLGEALFGKSNQRCPECDAPIEFESINMQEGMAACNACRKLFKLSELNWSHRSREEILAKKPWGCSMTPWGQGLILTASTRSLPTFLGTLFACVFWNGIVSVFLSLAVAGLWANLVGPLPDWMPIPGGIREGKPVMNDAPMPLGMTLFLCLFLVPFVLIGTGLFFGALMALLGRVKVLIDQDDSFVSTGIGPLAWKRRFDAASIQAVRFFNTRGDAESAGKSTIQLIGDKQIEFGSTLPAERREWLAVNLQEIFTPKDGDDSSRGRSFPLQSPNRLG